MATYACPWMMVITILCSLEEQVDSKATPESLMLQIWQARALGLIRIILRVQI